MTIDLDLLLKAYASGIFPMADARDDPDTFWVEPKTRAIIPLDNFRMSRSLRKTIRSDRFRVSTDSAFADVIRICASEADDRQETWINAEIEQAFNQLHQLGHAHSVECWLWNAESGEEDLVGGLYGLAIGGAFCGESMFSRASDASKVALAWLVARLKVGGFPLLDCQFMTDHLASLGAVEISQKAYLAMLGKVRNYAPSSDSAIRSPIRSSGGLLAGGAGLAAGAGAGLGAAAGGDGDSVSVSFGALDILLARLDDDVRGAVGLTEFSGGFSSPGKLIAQLLTQTS
ncbi:leucyl/phenylalanyl-tRNA--protein transferase [Sphingorhabdus sp. 109]|jgi:leucyl/phenylalanyl-tRNA--protein transferase|uniref:leucyl/phenylalanyl-tRNA--protein transferase n=1 Tax=Sphingorhabdus sp. 109 TaxID=2653173 RepID=UPI0012F0C812|nr:leucyl/phenylalanyl-tRNA--protein transferase [Sphingorhabdus sp. 109]VWX61343.1 Leucyl/phenylalanyl-tRNA--protein transferase [Sphingorhabdus sp. 109]